VVVHESSRSSINTTFAWNTCVLAVALELAMILSTWAAKRIIEKMPAERFRNFVAALLVLILLQMLLFG